MTDALAQYNFRNTHYFGRQPRNGLEWAARVDAAITRLDKEEEQKNDNR